ncbi:MAG: VOC family protein [Caulobacteraceae bacterium]|nr:VOC family protein [Caulobacteraceae bacterium]
MVFPIWEAEASLTFYGEVLGLPLIDAFGGDDWGGMPWLMMIFAVGDGRELVLVARRGAAPPSDDTTPADIRHYAFSVGSADKQDAWRAKLATAGVNLWEEDHGRQHSLYFADPNGVILEITTPASSPGSTPRPEALAFARGWIRETAALTL